MVQTALVRLIYRRRIRRPKRSKEIRRGGKPLSLLADPDRVHQLLSNLLGNALRYCDEGSTIGGYILFPDDVRERMPPINGSSG